MWDSQKVRDELPDVPVRGYDGKIYMGKINGRLDEFTLVRWQEKG